MVELTRQQKAALAYIEAWREWDDVPPSTMLLECPNNPFISCLEYLDLAAYRHPDFANGLPAIGWVTTLYGADPVKNTRVIEITFKPKRLSAEEVFEKTAKMDALGNVRMVTLGNWDGFSLSK